MFVLLLVGVVANALVLVVVACLGLYAVEVLMHRLLGSVFPRQIDVVRSELHPRLLLEQALVLVFILRTGKLSEGAEDVVVLAVVLHQVLRVTYSGLQLTDSRLRFRRAELRNIDVPGIAKPDRPRLLDQRGLLSIAGAGALLPAALAWALLGTGSYALVAPAAVLMALVSLAVVLAIAPSVLKLARLPRGDKLVRLVNEAVRQHEPEVILYSNGGPDDRHWVTSWLGTLDDIPRRAVVLLRSPGVIDLLPPADTPVVALPETRDVLPFELPTARVALYVANSPENVRLLRNPRLRSAFIGHGESDKAASAGPLAKMYDEVWVAGEAGRERYAEGDFGVRLEGIRIVGRPQVRRVQRGSGPASGGPYSVLYAPTWEGMFGDPYESSLLHSGLDIVRTLLSVDGIRVLYRPHPKTGARNHEMVRVDREIIAMLTAAGQGLSSTAARDIELHSALNMADALVSDVSAVVSDFLASEKPYFVVNGAGGSDEEFRRRNPSAGGAYLVDRGAGRLESGLADARGPDTMRERRREVRTHLIGPPTDDPLDVFARAIDTLGATLRTGAGM